jgi:DNA processing protein
MTLPTTIPDDPRERAAYVALALTPGIGSRLPDILTACHTPLGAVLAPSAFLGAAGFSPAACTAIRSATVDAGQRVLRAAQAMGVTVVFPGDTTFPARLAEIPDPPRLLFALGDLSLAGRTAVAVVGSRNHSDYGLHACRAVVDAAVAAGAVVVSGMARGIDAHAHARALDDGGSTIGILGNGIGHVYPAANRQLYDRVARDGLLLTEMPPGERPRVYTFPHRNRLIAGLAVITVVVEGARTSGSLITAAAALDAGREVMAVPGPITEATSDGTNALIRDGAAPFLGPDDLWSRLPGSPSPALVPGVQEVLALAPSVPSPPRRRELPPGLSDAETRIAHVLADGEQDVDGIARLAQMESGLALVELLSLELRAVVEARPGRRYRLRTEA